MNLGDDKPRTQCPPGGSGASRSDPFGAQSAMVTCVSRVMRNSMRQLLEIGIGLFASLRHSQTLPDAAGRTV